MRWVSSFTREFHSWHHGAKLGFFVRIVPPQRLMGHGGPLFWCSSCMLAFIDQIRYSDGVLFQYTQLALNTKFFVFFFK